MHLSKHWAWVGVLGVAVFAGGLWAGATRWGKVAPGEGDGGANVGLFEFRETQQQAGISFHFTDATESAGVANPEGKSMQAIFCDFDNDGWPDLYVASDVGTADLLYHNRRDGTFEEVSLEAGTHDRRASMGLAVGDIWHRGWMDLFSTHWVAEDHAVRSKATARASA